MRIEYEFDPDKAVAVMVELLRALGPIDKLKLIKLLYLAERDCFLEFGYPITGDYFVAMQHGPVPSGCLDVLNDQMQSDVFSYLHVRDKEVSLDDAPPNSLPATLAAEEQTIIERTLKQYGQMTTGQLYRFVHELPEYNDAYTPGAARQIPFEKILEHHGTERQFREGRPVITREMRKHLKCPFPKSETPI